MHIILSSFLLFYRLIQSIKNDKPLPDQLRWSTEHLHDIIVAWFICVNNAALPQHFRSFKSGENLSVKVQNENAVDQIELI